MSESIPPAGTETELPILPLRNSVLFPASVVPVNVGRPRSVRLIEEAFGSDRPTIGVVAQRKVETEDPEFDEIFHVGTVARVLKVIRLSSGNYSVVLQGVARMRVLEEVSRQPCMTARIKRLHESPLGSDDEVDALVAHLREAARRLQEALPGHTREASQVLDNVHELGSLADLVASNLPVSTEQKQQVLELFEARARARRVLELVNRQSEVHRVKQEISTMVREEMSRSQREYLLRQQMKAIRRELGEADDEDDLEELMDKLAQAQLPKEPDRAARKQLSRMRSMSPAGGEYHVCRQYVEWLCELPWEKSTPDRLDVTEARRVLDEDHYGLEKVKKRILEYIAVRKLRSDKKGPILCLVGPPGVGKTSLGKSIARATGREFVRVAMGGVQDEAEVRGHRRTYVGSFPGRFIAGLKKAGSRNPVMILDEVDKLGRSNRGDPASALLEVLDPAQNDAFVDHYIEVPVDLSQVMFIATANRKDTIPGPLLDRMEVIDLPGYTRAEKISIAKQFLVPKQLSEHGLSPERLDVLDSAIDVLVDEHTREAGVRVLEQKVAALCRGVAVRLAKGEDVQIQAGPEFVEEVLGPPRFKRQEVDREMRPGVSIGLSWSPAGGDIMIIESTRMAGRGQVHLTGNMGNVMKESVHAALTYVRSHMTDFGLPVDILQKLDVHLHLPQGAIPKDGPSAGVAIFVSLVSMLTRVKAKANIGMTGELTLRGAVLKVGGVKEKCLAAHRAGMKELILPKPNLPDLEEVPESVLKDLKIHPVSRLDEVLTLALESDPRVSPQVVAPTP